MVMGSPDDLFKTARYRGSVGSSARARLLWQGSDKLIQPCVGSPLKSAVEALAFFDLHG